MILKYIKSSTKEFLENIWTVPKTIDTRTTLFLCSILLMVIYTISTRGISNKGVNSFYAALRAKDSLKERTVFDIYSSNKTEQYNILSEVSQRLSEQNEQKLKNNSSSNNAPRLTVPQKAIRKNDTNTEITVKRNTHQKKYTQPKIEPKNEVQSKNEPKPIEKTYTLRELDVAPRFSGCESESSASKRRKCWQKRLQTFIYSNLKYPQQAKENDTEGTCVIKFDILKDGTINNIKTIKDIGDGCGEEAKRIVQLFNTANEKWIPGKRHGIAVTTQYQLKIRFKNPS